MQLTSSEKTLAVRDEALLLSGGGLSLESGKVAKVLHFFGVPWRAGTVTEFLGYTGLDHESSGKSRVLCSSDTFFELVRGLEDNSGAIRPWREHRPGSFQSADFGAGNGSP